MTFKVIRDHKFKILFMYYSGNTDVNQLLFNYFENLPYEEDDDENNYTKDMLKTYKNISRVVIENNNDRIENESDKAVTIKLSENDNINDIKNKVFDIISKSGEIDKLISENLESWDIKRVGKAELTIIRLAIYEMYYDTSIDVRIAINEAIELSKVYGEDKSPKFVNGVLATINKKRVQ